jgi:hypothetical protein
MKASPEIIAYLEHAAKSAPITEKMERDTLQVTELLGRKNKRFAFFLTHHKRDAAAIVDLLRLHLAKRMDLDPSYVFLDSENLNDLRVLLDEVKSSLVLIVILTKDVLTRPWCLAEIYSAIEAQVPIVAVNIEGQGNPYNFDASLAFLQSTDFASTLEAANPGAVDVLSKQGIDVEKLGKAVGGVLPYIIAKPYNVSASERIRDAQLLDILDAAMEKI